METSPQSSELSKISKLFLQRRLDEATSLLLPYIRNPASTNGLTKSIIWILYLRVATEKYPITKDDTEWKQCIQGFSGVGYIPADVLVAG